MKENKTTYYCSTCQKQVTWHFQPVNHLKQALLSLVTVGLWLPMWLGLTLVKVKYCDKCQSPLSDD